MKARHLFFSVLFAVFSISAQPTVAAEAAAPAAQPQISIRIASYDQLNAQVSAFIEAVFPDLLPAFQQQMPQLHQSLKEEFDLSLDLKRPLGLFLFDLSPEALEALQENMELPEDAKLLGALPLAVVPTEEAILEAGCTKEADNVWKGTLSGEEAEDACDTVYFTIQDQVLYVSNSKKPLDAPPAVAMPDAYAGALVAYDMNASLLPTGPGQRKPDFSRLTCGLWFSKADGLTAIAKADLIRPAELQEADTLQPERPVFPGKPILYSKCAAFSPIDNAFPAEALEPIAAMIPADRTEAFRSLAKRVAELSPINVRNEIGLFLSDEGMVCGKTYTEMKDVEQGRTVMRLYGDILRFLSPTLAEKPGNLFTDDAVHVEQALTVGPEPTALLIPIFGERIVLDAKLDETGKLRTSISDGSPVPQGEPSDEYAKAFALAQKNHLQGRPFSATIFSLEQCVRTVARSLGAFGVVQFPEPTPGAVSTSLSLMESPVSMAQVMNIPVPELKFIADFFIANFFGEDAEEVDFDESLDDGVSVKSSGVPTKPEGADDTLQWRME